MKGEKLKIIRKNKIKKANKIFRKSNNFLKTFILLIIFLHSLIIIGFFIPKELKEKLILETNKIKLINIYSHIFIHRDINHFNQNFLSFVVISIFFLIFFTKKIINRKKLFISFITILLITPIISSFLWYLSSEIFNLNEITMGFSGVLAAYSIFILYFSLTYYIPLYQKIKVPKNETFFSILLIILYMFANRYGVKLYQNIRADIIILLLLAFFLSILYRKMKTRKIKDYIKIFSILFSVFIICHFAFPYETNNVDIISHFAGLFTGLFIGFLLYYDNNGYL